MANSNITLDFKFSSPVAEAFFNCSARNIAWNSGYGAGKTYAACQKILALMCKFPNYRVAIGRQTNKALQSTTKKTFFKVCPAGLYDESNGGRNVQDSVRLINGSEILWMHFDDQSEGDLRSLEINAAIIDQAEEVPEQVYLTLDSRVGRWDKVEIPPDLIKANPKWPTNEFTGRYEAPAYMIVLFNPPDEDEFSYLYQRFHPESLEYSKYANSHVYFQSASHQNKALNKENLATMMTRDAEWRERYVEGKFTRGAGGIHTILPDSFLEVDAEFVEEKIIKGATLCRVLDHGASSPTCCTWWAAKDGQYFCYREYYQPEQIISYHRERISELSTGAEYYAANYADPSIFKKSQEKYGGFWSVADEYADRKLLSPPISFIPADNNEFSTRNRINELLAINPTAIHPLTGQVGAPLIYFIRKTSTYPHGCEHLIRETVSQKKKVLAEINGKKIYSDEREDSISDHAYDTLRYFCATHLRSASEVKPRVKPGTFFAARDRARAVAYMQHRDMYGMPVR